MAILANSNYHPLIIGIDENGYLYCSDKFHMSGLFYKSELEQIRDAVLATLELYDYQEITDDLVDEKDKIAMDLELSRFSNSRKTKKEETIDDLYLIHDLDSNLLKIGRSKNAKKRLKQLQTANGNKLELVCVIKGSGSNETLLQEHFKDLRKEGEWFIFDESILDQFILLGGNINNYKEKKENYIKEKKEKKFTKPTVEEIQAYIAEKGYHIDAEYFFNYYESNGWKVGRVPMKSWTHAIANWERKYLERNSPKKQNVQIQSDDSVVIGGQTYK